jgi:hypothetical protein
MALAAGLLLAARAGAFVSGEAATGVIGQPDLVSGSVNQGGAVGANTLQFPYGHSWDGTYLWVSDTNNHRVLRFTGLPVSPNASADLVLGQPDFFSVQQNQAGSPAANTLAYPGGVFSSGTQLFVADAANHRVLIWNSLPTTADQAADLVLGQANFANVGANECGCATPTAQSMNYPTDVKVINGHLFVGDKNNSRLLVFNSIPTASHSAADFALFQPDLSSAQPNQGQAAPGPATADLVTGFATDGTRLAVADASNNRVLIFNSIPTTMDASADVAVGQPDLVSANVGTGLATQLFGPRDALFSNGRLLVLDGGWNRALVYNSVPTASGAAADAVLGQSAFGMTAINGGQAGVCAVGLDLPSHLGLYNGLLFVADWYNHRLLAYPDTAPSPTPSPTASRTPVPWAAGNGDHRLHCGPSAIQGGHGSIGIDARSLSGGICKLRVLRNSGRTLCHLWAGVLAPGGAHHQDWAGTAEDGESLASGVYYVAFTDGDGTVAVHKVLIIR